MGNLFILIQHTRKYGEELAKVYMTTPIHLLTPYTLMIKKELCKRIWEKTTLLKGLFDEQYRIIRPDGTIRWIWARTFPIYDENGRMIRSVGIGDDITKIKELEEEALKNKMEQEMARLDKLSLVGAVAAGIGHEVRNPMTTVRGYSATVRQ